MNSISKPNTKPAPLGRGLSALFGDADASYQPKVTVLGGSHTSQSGTNITTTAGLRTVPLTWLQPGAFQPRRHFDEEALRGLADSIRERGILEPLIVRPIADLKDSFEIIAGERRWRASQMAGLHNLPVVVRNLTDREALEFGIIENVQRQDLSPLEEAEGYQRLISEFNYTQENLAKTVGKSRPHITNMMRLLTLPSAVKQMIDDGQLSLGHARALIPARDPTALAHEVIRKQLNVRKTEALAKTVIENRQIHKKKDAPKGENADVMMLEKELERVIGLKVKIETLGKAGSLTLFYTDLDQLDDIIKKLRA